MAKQPLSDLWSQLRRAPNRILRLKRDPALEGRPSEGRPRRGASVFASACGSTIRPIEEHGCRAKRLEPAQRRQRVRPPPSPHRSPVHRPAHQATRFQARSTSESFQPHQELRWRPGCREPPSSSLCQRPGVTPTVANGREAQQRARASASQVSHCALATPTAATRPG